MIGAHDPEQKSQDEIPRLSAVDSRAGEKIPGNPLRVAVVTGAARGIGAATARRLATDGAAVAVVDLDAGSCSATVKAITAGGGRAIAVSADVSKDDQVEMAVDRVAADWGRPWC
jgi:3-oxoacyl-[acyl-carrier protein] reductase